MNPPLEVKTTLRELADPEQMAREHPRYVKEREQRAAQAAAVRKRMQEYLKK